MLCRSILAVFSKVVFGCLLTNMHRLISKKTRGIENSMDDGHKLKN